MNAKAIIFDLDGTLVESLPGIAQALNLTLADLGLPAKSDTEVRSYIGDGLWMLIRRALDAEQFTDAQVDEIQEPFQAHYKAVWKEGTVLFDGVVSLIQKLNEAGKTVGVLSNKKHPSTVEIVELLLGRDQVPVIYGQRDGIAKKPEAAPLLAICEELELSPEEVCYVGDSTIDLETAKNAGTQGVGVTWGYHDLDALLPYGFTLCDDMVTLEGELLGDS